MSKLEKTSDITVLVKLIKIDFTYWEKKISLVTNNFGISTHFL